MRTCCCGGCDGVCIDIECDEMLFVNGEDCDDRSGGAVPSAMTSSSSSYIGDELALNMIYKSIYEACQ